MILQGSDIPVTTEECDLLSSKLYDYADADFSGDVSREEVLAEPWPNQGLLSSAIVIIV